MGGQNILNDGYEDFVCIFRGHFKTVIAKGLFQGVKSLFLGSRYRKGILFRYFNLKYFSKYA